MKDRTITVLSAVSVGCFAAGVPCGNVGLREVMRGPRFVAALDGTKPVPPGAADVEIAERKP